MITIVGILLLSSCNNSGNSEVTSEYTGIIKELDNWLKTSESERKLISETKFATTSLSKEESRLASELIFKSYQDKLKKSIESQWKNKAFVIGDKTMKFEYKTFGSKPADGRSLYISMHGGGGAPAEVNDQQWENQKRLYQLNEGIYFVPRAPTDTWNLWHRDHIDKFFKTVIEACVAYLDVNPNKVYVMGYSAGGDGTYQLAPRMADRWAAAAMMAGHPNETSPLSLRNIGFAIFMGGEDAAFKRNTIAAEWKTKLADLQADDPTGYKHKVTIYEGLGHWMNNKDKEALPWMATFTRNPYPNKIVWKQDDVVHKYFYWIGVPEANSGDRHETVVELSGNEINITKFEPNVLDFYLSDNVVDLNKEVIIKNNGIEVFKGKLNRTIENIWNSINSRGEIAYSFPVKYSLTKN